MSSNRIALLPANSAIVAANRDDHAADWSLRSWPMFAQSGEAKSVLLAASKALSSV